ncbi:PTS transporter subunit IIC [Streptococcus sobrinus]|uniref:Uncharacterized protein n=1 Tax=Streptococcus sobrinus TaxID=1310 RepID=A0ABM6W6I7_9STRE|nr:hypothetical protein DK182_08280 [Streptococcus sobrinus]SQG14149.1 PTS system, galactitol-specific IIC [Streptococcus sobrinus]
MTTLTNIVQSILNMGSSVVLPIIIFILAMVFRVPLKKAITSGLTVGIGMLGINLVLGLLSDNVGPAAQAMVERMGLNLTVTDGVGLDIVYDCSGAIQAVNTALPLLKKGGTLQQVGLFSKDLNAMDQRTIIQHEVNYIGSRSQNPFDWDIVIHLESKGAINAEKMVTAVYDLEHWRDAFAAMADGKELKVLIASNPEELS